MPWRNYVPKDTCNMSGVTPTTIVLGGHIDHGKSTLIGRLMVETGAVSKDHLEKVEKNCAQTGRQFQYAYFLDALEAEQKNNITIDTSQVQLPIHGRPFTFIDAPGHWEYLKNMVTGASQAHAALFLVDALDGIRDQSRRHAAVLRLLGIRNIVVAINKMDLISWSRERFLELQDELEEMFAGSDLLPNSWIPISAYHGDNVATNSSRTPWYEGPSLLEILKTIGKETARPNLPLRISVQDVYEKNTVVGRVSSGEFRRGDQVLIWPEGRKGQITEIKTWPNTDAKVFARAGESIAIVTDADGKIVRGNVITGIEEPPRVTKSVQVSLFWMGRHPLKTFPKKKYILKVATQSTAAVPVRIHQVYDYGQRDSLASPSTSIVRRFEFARVELSLDQPMVFDDFSLIPEFGRFVLMDGSNVVGGGIIDGEQSQEVGP